VEAARDSRFVTRLWWAVAALLGLLLLLVGQSILKSRHQHEEQAVIETSSVARVLESDLSGLVDKVKLALHTVATEQERRLARVGGDPRATYQYVASIRANLPEVEAILLSDAEGAIAFAGDFAMEPEPAVGGERYFTRLRDECVSGIVISEPHRNGSKGSRAIDIARRIEFPDGRLAGAAIARVPVDRLVKLLAAVDVGSDGSVVLRGESLGMIARHPPAKAGADGLPPPDQLRDLVARGEISGWFRAHSRTDGIERVYSYYKVDGYPLHVTVGRATAEYLSHWRRDMGVVALLAAALFAVTIGSTLMVDRAWRRQRRAARLLESQAHTDVLTGLANRRHFFESAEAELARAKRYAIPLSLLMLDIDHFKEVNDAHGHRTGDRVLQQLARTCLEVLRTVDVVGRVGGEEFAVLLPETALEGAVEVAERLRQAIAEAEVARDEGVPLRITVSIGVATLDDNANLDTLMSRADAALYDAKHHGRDRVRVFGQPP
jgi:diguanylate cyclase (GGDEF)-like protein